MITSVHTQETKIKIQKFTNQFELVLVLETKFKHLQKFDLQINSLDIFSFRLND